MFLALAEIRHSKLRYALIMMTIALIGYLTFILTALAFGLAQSNRSAVDSWNASGIVLNADADGNLRQSTLSAAQVSTATGTQGSAAVGELSAIVTHPNATGKSTAELLGIRRGEFIYDSMNLTQGRRFSSAHEVVADDSMKTQGYALGDKVKVGSDNTELTIVGFVHNAKLSVAPVIYLPLETWHDIKYSSASPGAETPQASAVVLNSDAPAASPEGTERLDIAAFIEKLPGYSAQNITFSIMIGFLFVITLVIIAIFQYILTMQKIPHYMVLKIQGIPTGFLVRSMLLQALFIGLTGVTVAAVLTAATALVIPPSVPMSFNTSLLAAAAVAIVAMSALGSLASVRTIATIKPTSIVAGE